MEGVSKGSGSGRQRRLNQFEIAAILEAYNSNVSTVVIARRHCVSPPAVLALLKRCGISIRGRSEAGKLKWMDIEFRKQESNRRKLQHQKEFRICSRCQKRGPINIFYPGRGKPNGHSTCKDCMNALAREIWKRPEVRAKKGAIKAAWKKANRPSLNQRQAKRRMRIKQQQPKWADINKMRAIYKEAALLCAHVDHIVPLLSPIVCGLHWEGNLQILSAEENLRKGNRLMDDAFTLEDSGHGSRNYRARSTLTGEEVYGSA